MCYLEKLEARVNLYHDLFPGYPYTVSFSQKKICIHIPRRYYVKQCPMVVAILNFPSTQINETFVRIYRITFPYTAWVE